MPDYPAIVRALKSTHHIRVRKWRSNPSGSAWRVRHADGRTINWIESPRPASPLTLAIFLHEIGHHVIGFDRYRTRCQEEHHAWNFALSELVRLGVPIDAAVRRRHADSMRYAVQRAKSRGLKTLPPELRRFAA